MTGPLYLKTVGVCWCLLREPDSTKFQDGHGVDTEPVGEKLGQTVDLVLHVLALHHEDDHEDGAEETEVQLSSEVVRQDLYEVELLEVGQLPPGLLAGLCKPHCAEEELVNELYETGQLPGTRHSALAELLALSVNELGPDM